MERALPTRPRAVETAAVDPREKLRVCGVPRGMGCEPHSKDGGSTAGRVTESQAQAPWGPEHGRPWPPCWRMLAAHLPQVRSPWCSLRTPTRSCCLEEARRGPGDCGESPGSRGREEGRTPSPEGLLEKQ